MVADPAAKQDVVEGLRFRHARGKDLLDEFPVGAKPGEPWPARPQYHTGGHIEARAKEQRITPQELHFRRRFAFLYSGEDVDRLCGYQKPPSWSAVKWLLRVNDRDERLELELKAVEKGWTAADLKNEIRRRKKGKHGGGRPPKLPTTISAGLDATADLIVRLEIMLEHVLLGERALAKKKQPKSRAGNDRHQAMLVAAKMAVDALGELQESMRVERSARQQVRKGGAAD